ncbi:MAG: hypothetical protein ABI748_11290 [Dokdonella sp.]
MNRCGAPTIVDATANPILLALTFARRRRVQRALAQRGVAACCIVAFVVLSALIALGALPLLHLHGAMLLAPLIAHTFAATLATVAISWAATARSRRRIEWQLAQSWLACAPISVRDRLAALRWRVGGEVLVPFAAVLASIFAAGLASGTVITPLIAAAALGFATGAALGWRTGAKPARSRAAAPPRLRPSRAATSLVASLAPLEHWPFAQLRAAANPRLEVRLLGALLLSLPMGIPPAIVLLLLAFAVTVLAALSLLRASLVMIPQGADWLRATPLDLGAFVRACCLRAGAWQVVLAAICDGIAHVLGAPTGAVFAFTSAWLVICITASVSALACRHRPARLMIERVGIGALLLAIASVAPLALMPVVPALWLCQTFRMRNA